MNVQKAVRYCIYIYDISQGINKYINEDSTQMPSLYATNLEAKGQCSGKLLY
jgi:hypothetical protein